MASIDFPNSPTDGQTFTSGNATYTYIAAKGYWDAVTTTSGIQLTSLSVGAENPADGDGAISYDNTTGVFTYTPPVISAGGIALTDLSVGAENPADGDGAISYDNTTGVFTYTPPVIASGLPTQSDNAGAFLTTDGSSASWDTLVTTTVTSPQLANTIVNTNPYGASTNDRFGIAITTDGTNVYIISADPDAPNGPGAIYAYNASTKAYLYTVTSPITTNNFAYEAGQVWSATAAKDGYLVATSGGSPSSVHIFNNSDGSFVRTIVRPAGGGTTTYNFGGSVDTVLGKTIIGDYAYNNGVAQVGRAYLYDNATGNLLHTFENPNPNTSNPNDSFGRAVKITSKYIVIAAMQEDIPATDDGVIHIFDANTYTLIRTISTNTTANEYFGWNVHLDTTGEYLTSNFNGNQGKIYEIATGALALTISAPAGRVGVWGYNNGFAMNEEYVIIADDSFNTYGRLHYYDKTTGSELFTVNNPKNAGRIGKQSDSMVLVGDSLFVSNEASVATGEGEIYVIEPLVTRTFSDDVAFTGAVTIGGVAPLALTDISVGAENPAEGDGAISYDNTTGVFTYTPPVISAGAVAEALDQGIATTDSPSFTGLTVSGTTTLDGITTLSTTTEKTSLPQYVMEYVLQSTLVASDRQVGDYFGQSVSISGDGLTLLVGASREDTGASNAGAAYIFTKSGSTWTQQAKIQSSDIDLNEEFGRSVSISSDGNTALIGAAWDNLGGSRAGAAYIFTRSGSTWSQQAKIVATDKEANDNFGKSVSISSDGNTAIVGAWYEDTGGANAGAAYIFTKSGTSWSQQAKITASDAQADDQFGHSVSISSDGNTAIVSAYFEDTGASNAGAAYIFVRSGTSWTQQAKIQASDAEASDYFGWSVSISGDGDTAIVGAYLEDTSGFDAGAAYIFTRSGSTWSQQAKIQSSDIEASDNFGMAVSISGDGNTAIVGVEMEDTGDTNAGAVYIFTRSGTSWSQKSKIMRNIVLANDRLGQSVSISSDGNTAIAGAMLYWEDGYQAGYQSERGAVYTIEAQAISSSILCDISQSSIFTHSGLTENITANFINVPTTTDRTIEVSLVIEQGATGYLPTAIQIDGVPQSFVWENGTTPDPSINASDIVKFTLIRSEGAWTVLASLTRFTDAAYPAGGIAPTSFTDIITFGTITEKTSLPEAMTETAIGLLLAEQAKIQSSDIEASDSFGSQVSISSDGLTAIVGVYGEDTGGANAGAAYIFTKSGATWSQQAKIQASDPEASDSFGYSVSISGDGNTAIVGAYSEDTGDTNAGAVYIFTRSGTSWTQQAKIQASDKQANDSFGISVAISSDGNTAIVSATGEDTGASGAGAAYIFTRSGTSWTQQAKIQASDIAASDFFGSSVSISSDGNTAIVGAYNKNTGASQSGAAYIFVRSGTSWSQQRKLQADPEIYGSFGAGVSISGDGNTAIVSAKGTGGPAAGGYEASGAAYIFVRSGTSWTQSQKILASDREAYDYFGTSVSISNDGLTAIVGAQHEATGASGAGAAYIFVRSGSTWTETQKILASDPEASDYFGGSVSISGDGNTAVVGAWGEDTGASGAGAAYMFSAEILVTVGFTHDISQSSVFSHSDLAADFIANFTNVPTTNDRNTEIELVIEQGTTGYLPTAIQIDGEAQTFVWENGAQPDPSINASDIVKFTLLRSADTWTVLASLARFTDVAYPLSPTFTGPVTVTGTTTLDGITTLSTTTEKTSLPVAAMDPLGFEQKIQASDRLTTAQFGFSTSISSDGLTAIVGANGSSLSAAYVYTRPTTSSTATWTQQAKIQASDAAAYDYFGTSVSISSDGNTAIVGADYEDPSTLSNAGSAYIFVRSGTSWTQQAKIQANDAEASDYFGFSVSISGDGNTAIVGAKNEDTGATDAGAAYIFVRSGTSWAQQAKIQASDLEATDNFGVSVSISGDGNTAILGAWYEDTGATDAGAAYIFTRSGTSWSQQAKIQASDAAAYDNFGFSVSISGDGNTAIVGATIEDTGATDAGAAYIFVRSGTSWAQQAKIQASVTEASAQFGNSVSLSTDGNTVIVGAWVEDSPTINAGGAYIFKRSDSTWSQAQRIQASDREVSDYFGMSVGISGDSSTVIVGARGEDTGATDAGSAYIFTAEISSILCDISQSSIFTHSGLTADFTANFTNVPTTNDRAISVAIIINQGVAGYLPTAIQIDGVAQTILWQTATAPTATINATDVASFTLIRSADTWSVLGTVTAFGSV